MHTSVKELLWGLHWLLICVPSKQKVLLLIHKAFTTSKPPYLSGMLASKKQVGTTRSSLKVNILDIPKQFLTMVALQRLFQLLDLVCGITLWMMSCEDVQMWNYLRKHSRLHCFSLFINANIVLTNCNLYACLFHSILLYSVSLYLLLSTEVCFSIHTLD